MEAEYIKLIKTPDQDQGRKVSQEQPAQGGRVVCTTSLNFRLFLLSYSLVSAVIDCADVFLHRSTRLKRADHVERRSCSVPPWSLTFVSSPLWPSRLAPRIANNSAEENDDPESKGEAFAKAKMMATASAEMRVNLALAIEYGTPIFSKASQFEFACAKRTPVLSSAAAARDESSARFSHDPGRKNTIGFEHREIATPPNTKRRLDFSFHFVSTRKPVSNGVKSNRHDTIGICKFDSKEQQILKKKMWSVERGTTSISVEETRVWAGLGLLVWCGAHPQHKTNFA
ncbi:hypothetical protein B0H12DRAFT_1219787 [Mycena haematopus]|nr:hypothetical protein B0H12DRAFT_1219787 [Mycena haematopus]